MNSLFITEYGVYLPLVLLTDKEPKQYACCSNRFRLKLKQDNLSSGNFTYALGTIETATNYNALLRSKYLYSI